MAEVNNCVEPTLPTKRIPDLTSQDSTIEPKKQKLENPETNFINNNNGKETPEPPQPFAENDVVNKEKAISIEEERKVEEEEEEEHSNGKAVIDRKGKGILIEEDEEEDEEEDDDSNDDDDSDDSDNNGDILSDDSEFADDPLAEVDLDNILPSRTRRKIINPGAYIASDLPAEDSDESDDPDA